MQVQLINSSNNSHNTVIQVIGIGGGGCNAIYRMIEQELEGVEFIAANTDLQALDSFSSPQAHKLPLGAKTTGGLGAGGNPEIGREAAEEDADKIKALVEKANMVFLTAGMGGGTGTGAAPVIARIAKEMGKLCVAVITMPFLFEGKRKNQIATEGIEELRKHADTIIAIPNQLLLSILPAGTSVKEAFLQADEVLRMGVKGIADLIIQPGDINVDFNDVYTVMHNGGEAIMSIGYGQGENRAIEAATEALQNPLLEGVKMSGATGLLVQITGDETFSLDEYSLMMSAINEYVDIDNAVVISGISIDHNQREQIKVTVIATGFSHGDSGKKTAPLKNRAEKSPVSPAPRPAPKTEELQLQQSLHNPLYKTPKQAPTKQYHNRSAVEILEEEPGSRQLVTNAELEALMAETPPNPIMRPHPPGRTPTKGYSPAGQQSENLYIPTVLRRRQRNR